MSKGAVIVVVGVGVAIVLFGGVAMAATSSKPVIRPDLAPPPPPPAPPTLGQRLVQEGYTETKKAYETLTGTPLSTKTVVADVATGGLYSNSKIAINYGKKIWNSIF